MFQAHEERNFQYDQNTGTILRKPQDACQSIENHMKNLEIDLESPNSNENSDQTDQNSDANERVIRNTTPKGNSSSETINLQLSSEKENSEHGETSSPTSDSDGANTTLNKIKTPAKRKLYHRNASFVQGSSSLNSQIDQIIIPNPYNPSKRSDNCTKTKPTNTSIKLMHTKHVPRSGLKNIQYRNKLPTLVIFNRH